VKKASDTPEKGRKLAVRGSNDKNNFFSNSTTNLKSVTQNLPRNTHKERTGPKISSNGKPFHGPLNNVKIELEEISSHLALAVMT
jgi:hypothetical protein